MFIPGKDSRQFKTYGCEIILHRLHTFFLKTFACLNADYLENN